MKNIFTIPEDLITYFFRCLINRGKYTIENNNGVFLIIPREEERYYKPVIVVKDVNKLEISLRNYINSLNKFYDTYGGLQEFHNLGYFFINLLSNMTNDDAQDLTSYIDKRILMFEKDRLEPFNNRTEVVSIGDSKFFAQRELEKRGLETPFYMIFEMEKNDNIYQLPLIRYSIDNDTCYIYAVQMDRWRDYRYDDQEYKETINKVNSGLKKYRNIPPNFVLSLALFIKILSDNNISKIIIPDYLFSRYRNYYHASTETKSNKILDNILDRFLNLLCRMDTQVEGFDIISYPNDLDSYMRIKLNCPKSENQMLNEIFNGKR